MERVRAGQGLGLDFLAQTGAGVGSQRFPMYGRVHDAGQPTALEQDFCPVEADLGAGQGMQCKEQRPAAEEIGAAAAQLPGAASRQQKAGSPCVDQALHLVEDPGQLLNLVDHDDLMVVDGVAEGLRRRREPPEGFVVQEIDVEGLRKCVLEQRGLPGLPRAEEEQRPVLSEGTEVDLTLIHPVVSSLICFEIPWRSPDRITGETPAAGGGADGDGCQSKRPARCAGRDKPVSRHA